MTDEKKKGGMALMIAMGKPKSETSNEQVVEESPDGEVTDIDTSTKTSERGAYEIPVPDGYEPPNGSDPSKAFDTVCKVKLGENGTLRILSIDGIATDEESGEVTPDNETLESTDGIEDVPMETMKVEPNADKAFSSAMNRQRGM